MAVGLRKCRNFRESWHTASLATRRFAKRSRYHFTPWPIGSNMASRYRKSRMFSPSWRKHFTTGTRLIRGCSRALRNKRDCNQTISNEDRGQRERP
jgi:hypothetical protein